ncbi:hypothetical protein P879_11740 [Paragonimus westermani]|uniref:Uncharacterized protein n=1 Tax=Paragonimus westermani TaxID=34504 RepID=A0A8T0DAF1_9TREM|nr:hypothetical protein P879_11740 [Paragonimus westermani]
MKASISVYMLAMLLKHLQSTAILLAPSINLALQMLDLVTLMWILGWLNESNGVNYILTYTDCFASWSEAIAKAFTERGASNYDHRAIIATDHSIQFECPSCNSVPTVRLTLCSSYKLLANRSVGS